MGTGGWHHIAIVYDSLRTSAPVTQIYIDGVSESVSGGYNGVADPENTGNPVWLGRAEYNFGPTDSFYNGQMQEFRIDSAARSADWINLSYLTQQSSSIVSGGPIGGIAPLLASPSNGSVGQPSTLTLSWNSVASATSYTVNISTLSNFATTVFTSSGTALSASAALIGGVTYYWQAGASNGTLTAWSATWSFATVATFGQSPVILIPPPANGSGNVSITPTLTWNPVVSATSYELEVSSNNDGFATPAVYDVATLTGTSQIPTGLVNSQTYYWRANAYNAGNPVGGAGNGWSATWSFTTIVAQPGAPVLSLPASGSVSEPLTLSLSWAAGTGGAPASYTVEISTGSAFANTVFMQAGLTNTSASAANLANNTQYYWQVSSTNAAGTSGWSGAWSFTTIVTAPGTPISPTPANGAINQIYPSLTLQWSPGSGGLVASYNLNFGTSSAFSTTVAGGIGTPSYVVGSLASSTTYYWQVQAVNVASAAWSAIWSFTTNEDYTTWQSSQAITLNTSATGANTATKVANFPVLLRLTSLNAAGFFTAENSGGMNGADLRFANPVTGSHLAYDVDKINVPAQTALVWVAVDTVVPQSATQAITMYWGKPTAVSQSDSANVFVTGNGFKMVLHLNKRSSGTTFFDATGAGNNGTGDVNIQDTTGVYDRAAYLHCTGTTNTFLDGDSITIAGLLGSPATLTLSSWVRVDSVDQANTGVNGHLATILSMGDNASISDEGASGTGTDSINAAWFGSGSDWANYGWPSASLTGTSLLGTPNSSGSAMLHDGWRHVALVVNPSAGYSKVYLNGDSVRYIASANTLAWTAGGTRTVIGKHGNGHVGLKLGGSVCETRIESVARSSDWIKLCYANQGATDYLANPPPQAPVLSAPLSGVSTPLLSPTLSLNWSAPATGPAATSYTAQVSTSTTFGSTVFLQTGITATYVVPAGLVVGTQYYWRVSASNGGGTGAWSGVWSFNTIAGAPTLSSPANGSVYQPSTFVAYWNAVSGASSYGIQVSTSSGFATLAYSNSVSGGAYATVSVAPGLTYYWEVNATANGSTSAWSSVWSFTTSTTQAIPLVTSWNMASFNVVPQNDSASAVFGTGSPGFLFVKDNAGDVYCPTLSENDIGIVVPGQGYQVYTSEPDTFKLIGEPVNVAATPVALSAGWNMIGYLPTSADSIVHALAAIDSQLVLVKNNAGSAYWPAQNVDNIDSMCVGQGYKILMSTAATLFYPTPLSGVAKRVAGSVGKPMLRLPAPKHYAVHAITGNNATLLAKQVLFGDKLALIQAR